jgi:predicted transcriptional regulator
MKTLAIRLDDEFHAQLSVLAQLRESTITEEIRLALESHLESGKHDAGLTSRAQIVLDEIERESQARQAAIALLFGSSAAESSAKPPATSKSTSGKTNL